MQTKKLGSLIKITKGKKVSYGLDKSMYNYIDIGILRTGIIEQYTDDLGVFCKQDDILIAWDGSKSGTVGFGLEGVIGSTLAKLEIINSNIDSKYLGLFLQSQYHFLNTNTSGAAIPHIKKETLVGLDVYTPSLPTQHLIVSEIEKQFSRLDEGLLSLRRAKENLKKYKASVLKSAVEGKLTEDFRKTQKLEPARILLEKILEERKKKFLSENPGKKYKESEGIKQDDLPNIELPEGWEWCRLSDIFDVGTGSTPSKSNKEYWENGSIPWVSSSCVNLNFVDKADLYVTEKALQETNVKIFPIGTILIALYGEGKTRGNITELRIESTTNQALAGIIFDNINLSFKEYLKIFFLYNYDNIRKQSAGGVQPNLNVGKIKEIIFPLPPLSEQNEIVKIVESKLSVVEKLEKLVDENIKRSENLKQSILKKAFEGELVREE